MPRLLGALDLERDDETAEVPCPDDFRGPLQCVYWNSVVVSFTCSGSPAIFGRLTTDQ